MVKSPSKLWLRSLLKRHGLSLGSGGLVSNHGLLLHAPRIAGYAVNTSEMTACDNAGGAVSGQDGSGGVAGY